MSQIPAGGIHLLRALGLDPFMGGIFEELQNQPDTLQQLQDSFHRTAGQMGAFMLANLLQSGNVPASMFMPPPNSGACPCHGQYAQPRSFDFGASNNPLSLNGLFNRARGSQFEQFLSRDPGARAQVEMMLGGRIVSDGLADGRVTVQPFATNGITGGATPSAMAALQMLDQIGRAATAMGHGGGNGQYNAVMAGALNNLLQGWFAGNQLPPNAMQQLFGMGQGQGVGGPGGPTGSSALPSYAPHAGGAPGPHTGAFGIGAEGDASAVLNDPSLTVEDKVTLMIMLIMKKMDKDIEKQANYINDLQQQQSKGGKGGKGGGGGGNPSIDVETMKLKRMIDKRSQMFDMLRQIIDKYNQTAKGIIDSMGR